MPRRLVTLVAALALVAGAAHATPTASADDGVATFAHSDAELLRALVARAESGDAGAVVEAAKLVAEAGGDVSSSPLVDAVTNAYEHSPAAAAALQALIDRAAAGDPSAVLEVEQRAALAGVGTTPETEAVTKAWEESGQAKWEAKVLEEIRAGNRDLLFGILRTADLATGDHERSPFAQKASKAYDEYVAQGPPAPEETEKREGGGAPDPGEGSDRGGTADSGAKEEPKSESWKVTDYDANGNKTGEGTKTVTTDPDGTKTTVKEMTYSNGSTSKTTTVEDADGNVEETTVTTDEDGNTTTVTTTCDKNSNPDCGAGLTTPDQDTGAGLITAEDLQDARDRPTLHEMREHPANNPEDGGGFEPSDLDFDGKPDLVAGHLDGRIDPAPDAVELAVDQAPEVHVNNGAGPEYLPELQTDLGQPAPSGNGPIENNPQASFHP